MGNHGNKPYLIDGILFWELTTTLRLFRFLSLARKQWINPTSYPTGKKHGYDLLSGMNHQVLIPPRNMAFLLLETDYN